MTTGTPVAARPGATTVFGPSGSTGVTPGTSSVSGGLTGLGGTGPGGTPPTRAAVEPTRLGGASVLEPALAPRGATTNPAVPFAPVGGVGGAAPAEQRLSRASYLVEDDPDALAGELPRVAPPVIGA